MSFQSTSIIWKVLFCLQISGFVLSLIGFGTGTIVTYNLGTFSSTIGLWKYCAVGKCFDTYTTATFKDGNAAWLDASKGMMSICLIGQFVTILMTSAAFVTTLTKLLGWCTAAVSISSVLFGVVGSAVAIGEMKRIWDKDISQYGSYAPGYSFALFMVSQLVFLVGAGLHFLDSRSRTR